jgi:hypothetical protein
VIYRDVVNTLAKILQEEGAAPRRWRGNREGLARRLAPAAGCPACTLEQDAERRSAKTLLKHLDSAEVAESYAAAGGLCLPHFQVVLLHAGAEATRTLAEWQAGALSRLRDDLDELIRKHDHRFQHEPTTEGEATSWKRAVAAAVGEPEPGNRE